MPRNTVPDSQWVAFFGLLREGHTRNAAAQRVGLPYQTVYRLFRDPTPSKSGFRFYSAYMADNVPDPRERLAQPARKAIRDFAYFRLRYLGRVSTPWQVEAANRIVRLLESPEKEYLVQNVPPGSGKSTLLVDIVTWCIVRNRAVRILWGSRTERQAKQYALRIRRALERTKPYIATQPGELDAEACLAHDFGRFRPVRSELWRIEEFVVAQFGDVAAEEKEPTLAAFGMDSAFLGGRYDLVVWDDLVDKTVIRTLEAQEKQREWWDTEAETRLEPRGLLVLNGQRMAGEDLYRYCLDQKAAIGDDDDEEADPPPKYQHVVYKAHYDELCTGSHPHTAPPYPKGCLLDPKRLRWRDINQLRQNKRAMFEVLYQQEDTDPAGVLVPPVYIDGGTNPTTGIEHIGCWDKDRRCGELPKGLIDGTFRAITVDPSPTRNWSVQEWLYEPRFQMQYLLDQFRGVMEAPELLDWNHGEQAFTGLLEEWWLRARRQNKPITHVIVERAAAQRFLLQYEHVKRWTSSRNVIVVPHDTYANKSDPELGVETLAPHYAFGRVRLPGHQATRASVLPLYREVTRYPHSSTDDCVMAHWFLIWQAPRIFHVRPAEPYAFERPSWLHNARRGTQ